MPKFRNIARKFLAASPVVAAGSAFAAVPAEVSTALADMKTDALVVAGAFVVAIIAIKALGLMKRG